MNMRRLTALFSFVFGFASGGRVNYCGAKMCPSSECIGYIEAQLTQDEKSRLLARLNRRRSDAASGRLRGMDSAGNMMKLRWIEELAREAQLWANQCRPPSNPEERDECRDLYSVSVGQCITSVLGEAPGLRVESLVDMWYMQSLLYKGNVTSYVPSKNDRSFYGDFAQMLWSRSYMVGCGRSRFMIPLQGRLRSVERLVCNISPAGPPPYSALWISAEPASECPPRSRPDQKHPELCSYQLKMDESDILNNTMTIEEHVLLNSALEVENNESLSEIGSLDELYLTNLAIITMDKVETSTDLHSFSQKQDIVEVIDENNVTDSNKISRNKKTSKTKIKMIGRPKTYNMKELTEIGDDHTDDYHENEYVPKSINDIYVDYVDNQEENETTATETPRIKLKRELYGIEHNNEDKSRITPIANVINDSETVTEIIPPVEGNHSEILRPDDTEIEPSIIKKTGTFNNTLEPTEKNVEDLTDPETMDQLQQALDRMEIRKQNKITSKVRRELREFSDRGGSSTVSPELYLNKTLAADRGPMMSMVMKYMPFFKQYEGDFLGRNAARHLENYVSPTIALVLWILL